MRPPEHRTRRTQEDLDVEPGRPTLRVLQVQPDHFVKFNAVSAIHLPKPCDPRLDFQYSTTVPCLIRGYFVWNCRARTYQRHVTFQNVQELRQFVQAGSPQELSHLRDPLIIRELVDTISVSV